MKRLLLAALSGWATLVSLFAVDVFLVPHDSGFAPEMGPFGSFVFFVTLFSAVYFGAFLLSVVPLVLLFRRFLNWPAYFNLAVGAVIFLCIAYLIAVCSGIFSGRDNQIALIVFLAFPAIVCFKVALSVRQGGAAAAHSRRRGRG